MVDARPLRAATFRHLAASYSVNELGNVVGEVALAILVFDRTGSALATAALFLALTLLPALVAQPLTTRVEAIPVRAVLLSLYVLEAGIFAAMAAIAHRFSLPALLALSALDGALAITARALTRSANANHLLGAGLLREGNAILNLGSMSANALGPALGGAIVAWRGAGTALLIDAASFLLAAAIAATTPRLHIESDRQAGTAGRLRAGLRAIRARPALIRLFVAFGLAFMLASIAVPVEVVFAKRTLHAGDLGYGLLLATWGAGMVLGGVVFAALPQARLTLVLGLSALLIALGYGGLATSPDLAVACAFSAVGGVGNGVAGIAAITAIQQAIPLTVQSAVMAVMEGMIQVLPGAGFIAGGVLTALWSARVAYAVAAVGVAVVVIGAAGRRLGTLEAPPVAVEK